MKPLFLIRQIRYNLSTSLLFRPALFLGVGVLLSLLLPAAERAWLRPIAGFQTFHNIFFLEPASAQLLLATLAGALMSVISVVYSILLVALSLASIQFSTRILAGFMRDRVSQNVLGMFIGTFAWCLGTIRAIRLDPPDVPLFSVTAAVSMAPLCLAALVLFIHHIIRSIQANHLVDRIASEAEPIIRSVVPAAASPAAAWSPPADPPRLIAPVSSGYIQLIDRERLRALAAGRTIQLLRPMGSFATSGAPLIAVWGAADAAWEAELIDCIDIGPERTMQEDAEFGLRQIVDIGLKAISPAVNDPSTGATCVDHLGRLLGLAADRCPPPTDFPAAGGHLHIPDTTMIAMIDLAVEQLRQYGRADMAICLRLIRMLGDLAPRLREAPDRDRLRFHADQILSHAATVFSAGDCAELQRRHERLLQGCALPLRQP